MSSFEFRNIQGKEIAYFHQFDIGPYKRGVVYSQENPQNFLHTQVSPGTKKFNCIKYVTKYFNSDIKHTNFSE